MSRRLARQSAGSGFDSLAAKRPLAKTASSRGPWALKCAQRSWIGGVPTPRVHDLRHTAASVWLATGADSKVVQRILGHASAAMTMDLYGRLVDQNLWDAADKVGERTGGLD